MDFTCALHTYFAVSDVTSAKVKGLKGLKYEDNTKGGELGEQSEDLLEFAGEVDRVYLNAPEKLQIVDGDRLITVAKKGFPDAVLWNIGEAKAGGLADLGEGEWRRYACLEAGAIGSK